MIRRALIASSLLALHSLSQAQVVPAAPTGASAALSPSLLGDLQAGIKDDPASLTRAIGALRELLAQEPRHARALAWMGIAQATQASRLLETGKDWSAIADWEKGVEMLHRAVALAPDDAVARLGRGKFLSETAVHDPDPTRSADAARLAAEDLELALGKSSPDDPLPVTAWERARVHAWLADSYKKLSKPELEKLHREKADALRKPSTKPEADDASRSPADWLARRVIEGAAIDELSRSLAAELGAILRAQPEALQRARARVRLVKEGTPGDSAALAWTALLDWRESSQMFSRGRTPQAVKLSEGIVPALAKAVANDPKLALARAVRACHQLEQATYHPDPQAKSAALAQAGKDADALMEASRTPANILLRARVHARQGEKEAARRLASEIIESQSKSPQPDEELAKQARALAASLDR